MSDVTADVSRAIKGLEDLERKLQRKGIRQSLRASAKPTLAIAKSTAPVFSGLTQSNVKLRSGGARKGTYRINVGIGKKWFVGPMFYSAYVAFGHRIGRRQLGDVRRQLAPNDWLTKAYEQTKVTAIQIFKSTIEAFIDGAE